MLASALALALSLLAVPPATAAPDSLRCHGNLVTRGDLAIEVVDACGRPDFVDPWDESGHRHSHHFVPHIEEWTYNFGPSRLLYLLRFRRGKLVNIETVGHGFSTHDRHACSTDQLVPDLTKYRLLQLCGPPDQREHTFLLRPEHRGAHGVFTPIRREVWIYNFGERRLLREITLENSRVVEIDTRGRGFNR